MRNYSYHVLLTFVSCTLTVAAMASIAAKDMTADQKRMEEKCIVAEGLDEACRNMLPTSDLIEVSLVLTCCFLRSSPRASGSAGVMYAHPACCDNVPRFNHSASYEGNGLFYKCYGQVYLDTTSTWHQHHREQFIRANSLATAHCVAMTHLLKLEQHTAQLATVQKSVDSMNAELVSLNANLARLGGDLTNVNTTLTNGLQNTTDLINMRHAWISASVAAVQKTVINSSGELNITVHKLAKLNKNVEDRTSMSFAEYRQLHPVRMWFWFALYFVALVIPMLQGLHKQQDAFPVGSYVGSTLSMQLVVFSCACMDAIGFDTLGALFSVVPVLAYLCGDTNPVLFPVALVLMSVMRSNPTLMSNEVDKLVGRAGNRDDTIVGAMRIGLEESRRWQGYTCPETMGKMPLRHPTEAYANRFIKNGLDKTVAPERVARVDKPWETAAVRGFIGDPYAVPAQAWQRLSGWIRATIGPLVTYLGGIVLAAWAGSLVIWFISTSVLMRVCEMPFVGWVFYLQCRGV